MLPWNFQADERTSPASLDCIARDNNSIMVRKAAEEAVVTKPKEEARPEFGRLIRICAAGWVIPGCGHLLLGRRWRALIFFACIVAMFVFGPGMKGEFFSTQSGSFLQTLGYFGELCIGLAMPVARFFGYVGDPFFVSSDYGTAFLVSAGMLNLLTIMDAYDITVGRKN